MHHLIFLLNKIQLNVINTFLKSRYMYSRKNTFFPTKNNKYSKPNGFINEFWKWVFKHVQPIQPNLNLALIVLLLAWLRLPWLTIYDRRLKFHEDIGWKFSLFCFWLQAFQAWLYQGSLFKWFVDSRGASMMSHTREGTSMPIILKPPLNCEQVLDVGFYDWRRQCHRRSMILTTS